jgi:hypothetical protein
MLEYLGHNISAEGLRPMNDKVCAIVDAPAPQDITQLRAFLRLFNYYGNFLKNLSTLLAPLYRLLEKKTQWVGGKKQQTAFDKDRAQSLLRDNNNADLDKEGLAIIFGVKKFHGYLFGGKFTSCSDHKPLFS